MTKKASFWDIQVSLGISQLPVSEQLHLPSHLPSAHIQAPAV